jgi:hypothetical protein
MTTTQPRRPFTRWLTAPIRALRHLNDELTGAGEAIARSNRGAQSGWQADLEQAKRFQEAEAAKVLVGI